MVRLTLMLKTLCRSNLVFELGANLGQQLVEALSSVARGDWAHAAMAGVHGHDAKVVGLL